MASCRYRSGCEKKKYPASQDQSYNKMIALEEERFSSSVFVFQSNAK